MKFGTNEFFQYMNEHIIDINYDTFYIEVAKVVEDDARAIFFKRGFKPSHNISNEDIEDVLQEVQLSVLHGLLNFIKNSEGKSVSERNSWLATIINNRVNDFFRNLYKTIEKTAISLDDKDVYVDDRDGKDLENDLIKSIDNEDFIKLCNTLVNVFKIRTTPEKILAYLFNRFICAFSDTKKSSGSPKKVAEQLNGMTIECASEFMKQKINNVLGHKIQEDVFAELDKKVYAVNNGRSNAERLFYLSPRTITDSSNWIADKIKEDEGDIMEEGKKK